MGDFDDIILKYDGRICVAKDAIMKTIDKKRIRITTTVYESA
jgi:hypothetical protein